MTTRKRTVLGSLDNLPGWTMKDTVSLQIPQSGPLLLHKLVGHHEGLIACIPLEGIFLSLPARNFKCLFRERQAMVVTVKPGQGADMKPAVYAYPVPDYLYKCFDLAQRFLETCHKRSHGHAPPRTQSPPLFKTSLTVASSGQRDQCSVWSDVYEIDGIRVDQSRKTVTIVDDVLFSAATKTAKREWPIEALDLLDINSSTRSRINRALSLETQVDKERRRHRTTMPTDEVLLVTGRVALNGLGWALRLGERPSQDERQHSPRFLVLFRDAEELLVDRRTNTIVYQNKVYQTSSIGVDHPLSSRLALADELISLFS